VTFLTWANLYICAHVLLALTLVLLTALGRCNEMLRHPISYGHRLAVGHALLIAALVLPFATLVSGHDDALPQTAQVWSAPSMAGVASAASDEQRFAVTFAAGAGSMSFRTASGAAAAVVLLGMLVSLLKVGVDIRSTAGIVARAQTIRRIGRLSIRASQEVDVPFSFWRPARYFIVVPSALVLQPEDLTMAIRHEAQHHRQQDTKWLYFYRLLNALFFWNPAVHRIERDLRALQEFACDEALSARRPAAGLDYCRSLLRAAEAAVLPHRAPIRASMLDGGGRFLLKRRIEAVLSRPAQHQRKPAVVAAGVAALSVLSIAAFGCSGTIRDRRISADEAARMVAVARESSVVPVAANERVLRQLNLLLATPDGRAYLEASLERMKQYEPVLSAELGRQALPPELLALPLVESGYRNLDADGNPRHGAGLWMFIEPTARRYGLTVSDSRDERLDLAKATRAAGEYLAESYRRFGDWGLAILAYNTGSARVEAGMHATGSRDPWQIIEQGYENDRDYLARVTAAVLIMKNPSVLD
jgi:beta-lactamase regulating signal transducer with metallopeptidase domain